MSEITSYDFKMIEQQAQQYWDDHGSFVANIHEEKEKFYCLSMFPYPSGKLHVGHVRNYTLGDLISRFQRMNNKLVLQPIGWDAFGLPAENAAAQHGIAPEKWTKDNIAFMKKQFKSMGFAFDWTRELKTCDPSYYKWEQWFFTKLYAKNLAYQKTSMVNWCPKDQTVLANEQVNDGKCWRCDTKVEKKPLKQWFLRITHYADELLNELDQLEHWPEQVKTMQRNWIGRSEGAEIHFIIKANSAFQKSSIEPTLSVFTTRPDTLMGVTYLAIAPEHDIAKYLAQEQSALQQFLDECAQTSTTEADAATIDKKGYFTGLYAYHPVTEELIPIWVANFVLMEYGTGVVMSVPAHDQRDFEFATKYNLPIKKVICPIDQCEDINHTDRAFTEKGMLINSAQFDGLESDSAKTAIIQWLTTHNKGKQTIHYRLRDWGVSRQRYWGAPIPMAYFDNDEKVVIPEDQLPVELPAITSLNDTGSPLKQDQLWQSVCIDHKTARRETDTFDTFMESSWYYARYCSPHDNYNMLDPEAVNFWLPVDQYIGGIEHAVMHLLYARFFHKLLRDFGLVKSNEPFKQLLCQGMVLARAYYYLDQQGHKCWVNPKEVKIVKEENQLIVKHKDLDLILTDAGVSKMSKSKNNGVDPQPIIDQYGADSVRLYIIFAAPPEQNLEWSDNALEGAHRFLKRLWNHVNELKNNNPYHLMLTMDLNFDNQLLTAEQKKLRFATHTTINKVTYAIEKSMAFNTAVSASMELLNNINKFSVNTEKDYEVLLEASRVLLLLLSPITPHICHYLWQLLGYSNPIIDYDWPVVDEMALIQEACTVVLQVNGKVRAKIEISAHLTEDEFKKLAVENANVQKYLTNKKIDKIITVPKKLVNIVTQIEN